MKQKQKRMIFCAAVLLLAVMTGGCMNLPSGRAKAAAEVLPATETV